ncbi:coiled-coil domain-containing protein 9B [Gadus macrocephalus]|uniref:coiled-coil domain-containing protein 9B n=1 Tax=Gadus macrocephalus TaxID=80720 RepID=UPI0028CB8338|nr:coiled-coil domain-containing protein 9B [Gadus macrocephalus]
MERPTPSDVMLKRDHERDTDLDKKIEALRRKNAVLMRRYQEVEEDKKMAEEDVVSPQGRKGKADDLSITISKSASESRVVVAKRCAVGGQPGAGPSRTGEGSLPGCGRGRKKQLTVTMAGKKGKRVVSERAEPGPPGDGVRGPDQDPPAQGGDAAGGAKHAHHASSKRGPAAMQECEVAPPCTDLTVPTSPEELQDYLCWKRDRERIDRERVARHKNAKGQWRRAWDADKSESMFSDKCLPEKERGPTSRGGRNARRAHPRTHLQEPQGPVRDKVKDKGPKGVPGVSSKAQGVDRLTGRARRWDADEAGEPAQSTDTSLEELLEELDASSEPEDKEEDDANDQGGERKDRDPPKGKTFPGPEVIPSGVVPGGPASEGPERSGGSPAAGGGRPRTKNGAVSCPRGPEKRVRFSEELIKGAERPTASTGPAVPQPPLPREGGEVAVVGEAGEVGERGEVAEVGEASSSSRRTHRESADPQSPAPGPTDGAQPVVPQPVVPQPVVPQPVVPQPVVPQPVVPQPVVPQPVVPQPVVPQQVPSLTELGEQSSDAPPEQCGGCRPESPEGPTQHAKCNISNRNTEERIEGLSVLSLESRDTCSKAATNTDKARENGKIV